MRVSEDYKMDPNTEFLLENGADLRLGMVVLIADPDKRRSDTERGLWYSCWYRIIAIEVSYQNENNKRETGVVTIIGEHVGASSLTKRLVERVSEPWIVKINSTPEYKQQKALLEIVKGALNQSFAIGGSEAKNKYALEVSEKIIELFDQS